MHQSKLSRRCILGLTAAAVAAPFVSRTGVAAGKKEIVICSWGGSYQANQKKAFFTPFENSTGIKVIETSAPSVAKLKAMVGAKNVEWDVTAASTRLFYPMVSMNLIQEVDPKAFDLTEIIPAAVHTHGIATLGVTEVICYNPKLTKGIAPTGWADFWDVNKFPGSRAFISDVAFKPEIALLADGVDPDKLYPLDVERAFKKLESFKSNVKVWTTFNDQPSELVSKGEVVMAETNNGRVQQAQAAGLKDIDFVWNQGSIQYSYWAIPVGAKAKDEALEFLKFCLQPRPQADIARYTSFGPTNLKAFALLPEDVQKSLATYPENLKNQWSLNGQWLADNYAMLDERFQRLKIG